MDIGMKQLGTKKVQWISGLPVFCWSCRHILGTLLAPMTALWSSPKTRVKSWISKFSIKHVEKLIQILCDLLWIHAYKNIYIALLINTSHALSSCQYHFNTSLNLTHELRLISDSHSTVVISLFLHFYLFGNKIFNKVFKLHILIL